MKKKSSVLLVGSLLGLTSCASIVSGTSQEMTINTTPQGAECELHRDNKMVQRVTTPQTINIKKTKHDITVKCTKDGYEESMHFVKSEIQDATWGNIILGGGIGWAVDSASGADNKYAEYVNISMVPKGAAPAEAVAMGQAMSAETEMDGMSHEADEDKMEAPAMSMGMSMDAGETEMKPEGEDMPEEAMSPESN